MRESRTGKPGMLELDGLRVSQRWPTSILLYLSALRKLVLVGVKNDYEFFFFNKKNRILNFRISRQPYSKQL